jgi:hypothetical protein
MTLIGEINIMMKSESAKAYNCARINSSGQFHFDCINNPYKLVSIKPSDHLHKNTYLINFKINTFVFLSHLCLRFCCFVFNNYFGSACSLDHYLFSQFLQTSAFIDFHCCRNIDSLPGLVIQIKSKGYKI